MTTYTIEETYTGDTTASAIRTVTGTEMTIADGQIEIWISCEEAPRSLVFAVPAERVRSFASTTSVDPERTDGRYRQCSNCGHLQPVAETAILTRVA